MVARAAGVGVDVKARTSRPGPKNRPLSTAAAFVANLRAGGLGRTNGALPYSKK